MKKSYRLLSRVATGIFAVGMVGFGQEAVTSANAATVALKIRGIYQGFLRFLPCIYALTAKNLSISLFSDTS